MIISGSIGDHGVAIMSSRENLEFETAILSDSAALHGLTAAMIAAEASSSTVMKLSLTEILHFFFQNFRSIAWTRLQDEFIAPHTAAGTPPPPEGPR